VGDAGTTLVTTSDGNQYSSAIIANYVRAFFLNCQRA